MNTLRLFLMMLLLGLNFNSITTIAKTLEVGNGKEFANIRNAALQAVAGDTIFVFAGTYQGGMSIIGLQGTSENRISIIGEPDTEVIINAGTNAIQFSDAQHINIRNIVFRGQTGNGLNIDDAGSPDTPTEYITISNCTFRDINATGNNDLLKLSGLENFIIENCLFQNGAADGSGIDMVGCHYGRIKNCHFENLGSNGIQAKGGTQFIEISANYFVNCGQRALNLGGSTGLEFFRPIDAQFEVADLAVYSNVFIGSITPIAFVGCVRVEVINNTIINPEKWVIRILQETVDESRFLKCGYSRFENNIIYLGNLSTIVNVGSNTAPETFLFKNNFWYNHQNPNWQGPNLPTTEINSKIGMNPMFEDFDNLDFRLKEESTALHYIENTENPTLDYLGKTFQNPRSAGAFEYTKGTSVKDNVNSNFKIFPNPALDFIEINSNNLELFSQPNQSIIKIYNSFGEVVLETNINNDKHKINISQFSKGMYFININNKIEKFVKL